MPLLDHFAATLYPSRRFESFHAIWAASIMEELNRTLPARYFAEVQTHLGSRIEADVAEFEKTKSSQDLPTNGPVGGSLALQTWAPPATSLSMPAVFPDDIEVQVFDERDEARLVAVVELISPSNKDRPESRRAFAAKCCAYFQRGIGLLSVDIVSKHHFNLHNELVDLLGLTDPFPMAGQPYLYAVAYRPVRREERNLIDIWPAALEIDELLPLLPLALRGARSVPLNLEATYTAARQKSRL